MTFKQKVDPFFQKEAKQFLQSYGPDSVSVTHLCRVDFSTLTIWAGSYPNEECLFSFYCLPCIIATRLLNQNNIAPD